MQKNSGISVLFVSCQMTRDSSAMHYVGQYRGNLWQSESQHVSGVLNDKMWGTPMLPMLKFVGLHTAFDLINRINLALFKWRIRKLG